MSDPDHMDTRTNISPFSAQHSEVLAELPAAFDVDRLKCIQAKMKALSNASLATTDLTRNFVLLYELVILNECFVCLNDEQLLSTLKEMEELLKIMHRGKKNRNLVYLDHLYHQANGSRYAVLSSFNRAAWEQGIAHQLVVNVGSNDGSLAHLILGQRLMRVGRLELAEQAFTVADDGSERVSFFARRSRIELMLLRQDLRAAVELIDTCLKDCRDASHVAELEWLAELAKVAQGQPIAGLYTLVKNRFATDTTRHILFALYAFSVASRNWLNRLPKSETFRRKYGAELQTNRSSKALFRCWKLLESFYDYEIPIALRMAKLAQCLQASRKLPNLLHELVARAACVRALARHSQKSVLSIELEALRGMQRALGDGIFASDLGLVGDVEGRGLWQHSDVEMEQSAQALLSGKTSRAWSAVKIMGRVALSGLTHKAQALFVDRITRRRMEERRQESLALSIVSDLNRVRGVMAKVGQMVSFCVDMVPGHIRQILSMAQDGFEPLSKKQLAEIFVSEFQKAAEDVFCDWTDEPIAVASIGQVHRAKLESGEQVAIKVMHPDIAAAIKSDLSNMHLVTSFYKAFFPKQDVEGIVEQFNVLYESECDYQNEVANNRAFRELCDPDRIVLPKIYDAYTTKHIITMDYIKGDPFTSLLTEYEQATRNLIGEILFDFVLGNLIRNGLFYADPHPANFKIMEGERLGVVDFGAVVRWQPDDVRNFFRQIYFSITGQFKQFCAALNESGSVIDYKKYDYRLEYDCSRNARYLLFRESGPQVINLEMAAIMARASAQDSPNKHSGTIPPGFASAARLYWGLFYMLGMLSARADWRQLFMQMIEEGRVDLAS